MQIRMWLEMVRMSQLWTIFLILLCGSAIGQDAAPPQAATKPARLIRTGSATLTGMVVPSGAPTVAWFEWGADSSFGHQSGRLDAGSGRNVVWLTNHITGLVTGQTYHSRVVASNQWGVAYGKDEIFGVGQNVLDLSSVPSYSLLGYSNIVAIAENSTNLALTTDGTVIGWTSTMGPSLLPGLSNVVAIAGELGSTAVLKADGTIYAWGQNSDGVCDVPAGLTNVIEVSLGSGLGLALKSDGTVVAWGQRSDVGIYAPRSIVAGWSNIVAVSVCGGGGWWGLRSDGRVVPCAWTNTMPGLSNIVAISASFFDQDLALGQDGKVTGFAVITAGYHPPAGLSNIVEICAGGSSFQHLAITGDGILKMWGSGGYIFSGLSNVVAVTSLSSGLALQATPQPLTLSANTDAVLRLDGYFESSPVRISSLPAHGTLYQYDNGNRGTLIVENTSVTDPLGRVILVPDRNWHGVTTLAVLPPEPSMESAAVLSISVVARAPYAFTRAANRVMGSCVTLNGMVTPNGLPTSTWFEWGPTGAYNNRTATVEAGNGTGVVFVTNQLCNLAASTMVYHYRMVASNELGKTYGAERLFSLGSRISSRYPINRPDLTNVVSISGPLAIRNGEFVTAFRENWTGLPSNATTNVIALDVENYSPKLALKDDGTIVEWAFDGTAIESPSGLDNLISIAVAAPSCVALRSDGTVLRWDSKTNLVVGPRNVVEIAGNASATLMIKNDGTIIAIGASQYTNFPSDLSNVVQVAIDRYGSFALRLDGTLSASGGPVGVPLNLSNVVAIAGGEGRAAMAQDCSIWNWSYDTFETITNVHNCSAVFAWTEIADNCPPVCFPYSSATPSSEQLVLQLLANDRNSDPVTFRVVGLPQTNAKLFQYQDGARGSEIKEVNTPVIDPGGFVVFVPDVSGNGSIETGFDYVANDGTSDSNPATMVVRIEPRQQLFMSSVMLMGDTSAVLSAGVDTKSRTGSGWFEWGTNSSYGFTTPWTPLANGTNEIATISAIIGPLDPFTVYHYRLVTFDDDYSVFSDDLTFVSGPSLRFGGCSVKPSGAHLDYSGPSNCVFSVWASTNLTNWVQIGNTSEPSPGDYQFDDSEHDRYPTRFYQLRTP